MICAIRTPWRSSTPSRRLIAEGINHADFSIDGSYAIFTCEFDGTLAKVDFTKREVVGYLKLSKGGMPQDIRIAPDGKVFYVADMMADGVFLIDGDSFKEIGFIHTGVGTHGLYPEQRCDEALHYQSRIEQGSRRTSWTWEHHGTGFRDPQDRSDLADSRRRKS